MRSTKPTEFPKKLPREKNILAGEITDDEMRLIRSGQVQTDSPYELDDLDDDGKLRYSKRPS
jgi:hypothetical protein